MTLSSKRTLGIFPVVLFSFSALAMAASSTPPLVNWTAAPTYAPHRDARIRALADISNPVPFIATAPCRQYNSLSATPLLQAVNRAVTLTGAPCGIPASAVAVSVNITVFNITGATGNGVFKVDTVSPPAVAWINYPPTEAQRGNAGTVALNGSGQIIVQVAQGAGQVDFIVDTNGYYGATPATTTDPFIVNNAAGTGSAAIIGNNSSTASQAYAILGQITSSSPGSSSTAVRGINNGTGGSGLGVWGSQAGSGYGVLGTAVSGLGVFGSASGAGVGVYGDSGAGNGVDGFSYGTTGQTAGVLGFTSNTANGSGAAGVRGVDGSGAGTVLMGFTDGVRGEGKNGVEGFTNTPLGIAVRGLLYNTSGGLTAIGDLGKTGFGVYAELGDIGCTSCVKSFVDPHPTDASKVIRYASIEGRTPDTYFRGTSQTVNGFAVIQVPEDFKLVTDEEGLTVQLTPVGAAASLYVVSEDLNQIVIRSSKDVKFHYLVQGIRPAFKDYQPIQEGSVITFQSPDQRLPEALPQWTRQRLIENGTFHSDGTLNMETAKRLGWDKLMAPPSPLARPAPTPPTQD